MLKIVTIGSVVLSLILYVIFEITGEGSLLAYVLLGLSVSFTCVMMLLTEK